jgi:hypothetical protein
LPSDKRRVDINHLVHYKRPVRSSGGYNIVRFMHYKKVSHSSHTRDREMEKTGDMKGFHMHTIQLGTAIRTIKLYSKYQTFGNFPTVKSFKVR